MSDDGDIDYTPIFASAHTQPPDADVSMFAEAYLAAVEQECQREIVKSSNIQFEANEVQGNGKLAWSPEAGMAWKTLHDGYTAEAALQLGLADARIGKHGKVNVDLERKTRLFFEGYLFEVSGKVSLTFADGVVCVEMPETNQRIVWHAKEKGWELHDIQCTEDPFLNWIPAVEADGDSDIYVMQPLAAITQQRDWPVTTDVLPCLSSVPQSSCKKNEVRLAQGYINSFAPRCVNWVENITTAVLLHENAEPGMFSSHSSFLRPGLIWMGKGVEPALGGELLVHESSHQYLNLYKLLGKLVNGRDTQLYYSPIKRNHRPLEAILYAAHATINMLLYHADALKNGATNAVHLERIKSLFPMFCSTDAILSKSIGLSQLGYDLYRLAAKEIKMWDFKIMEEINVA